MKLRDNENFVVLGLFLAGVGLISALILAWFTQMVEKPIEEARLRNMNRALQQILPEFDNQPSENFVDLEYNGKTIRFMGAAFQGEIVGVAASHSANGYAGAVDGMTGFNPDGSIRAILITGQNETPGLGSNICERKFQKTIFNLMEPKPEGLPPNPILDQFNGKVAEPSVTWRVQKDGGSIEYVTGATVTCRTVTQIADDSAQCFIRHRETIMEALRQAGGK